ncbi:MAG: DNA recombination protein RmuC [Candidatus Staskawiczbacteria bacterium]|nr:DNA recombination protein RmuC [Candidatus Staskawiczbacteria bacterium]
MDLTTILLFIITIGLVIAIFLLLKKRPEPEKKEDNSILMLQQQINHISQVLDSKLSESNKNAQFQFNQSAKIIGDVTERLAKLDETNRQVVSFADQLQNLQDILKNPKQRGILGEYYLETVLKNVLPPGSYQMQYSFSDGKIVDAVVFVKDKIIPIDSKFSLENYNRIIEEKNPAEKEKLERIFKTDLKMRIDETSKYIKPSEGTMEFAFMFIPHEAIYYDLLINQVGAVNVNTQDLIEYAFKSKHVVIVSPTSFLAYLQTVLQGLKSLQIEESAKEIKKRVEMLSRHLLSYEDYMKKLGSHLSDTVVSYNKAGKEFEKIDKDVVKMIGKESKIEINTIETPSIDE